jgi:hypothetical protein
VTYAGGRAEAAATAMARCRPGDVLVSFTVVGSGREIAFAALRGPDEVVVGP